MTSLREFAGLATANIGLLLDAVPDPMIVTDVDGAILRVSKGAAAMLGYSGPDLKGRSLADLICEENRQHYGEHRAAFLASGAETAPELETYFLTARGSRLPIDAAVGKLTVEETTYLLLVMREVSDRLATQSRLEQMVAIDELTTSISSRLNTPDSEDIDEAIGASIRELADFCCTGAAYLFIETEPGTFALHSQSSYLDEPAALVALGLTALPWIRGLLEDPSISEVGTLDPGPQESAADCLLLRGEGVSSLVLVPLRASGRTIGFAGIESKDPLRPAWPGEDLAGLVVLQDVFENALERKRIGSELRRVNRVLHAVSECHDALIRAQDETELLRDVCRFVVEAGGYSLAWVGYALDDENRTIAQQAQWGEGRGFVEGLQLNWRDEGMGLGPAGTSVRTRKPSFVEDTSTDQDLAWHLQPYRHGFLSLVCVPMFFGDEVAGVLAVYDKEPGAFDARGVKVLQRFADDLAYGIAALRSRERQREAESQLRQLLDSKDELIASIAHELRTPLAGVVGFAQVLRDDVDLDPESRAEMVRLVAEQGMDLTNIVDDLLVAAKSEAGTLVVAQVRVDLRAQAAQVLEAWGSDLVGRVEFEGASAPTIGDPARVRQILRNLVSNAMRYGGDQIRVRVVADGETAHVRVEDNGNGVAPEEQERIFEPYSRAHDAPGLTASMGLGLSISRHLAQLMGGDLTYGGEPGLSVFTLSMPTLAE
ncbi:MAG TPA: ATP-binding protein [Acidimicrobiia bacterium]|nr:ATP-binding protein [Acidimicrobiia bacterium]